MPAPSDALAGISVLDLTRNFAGPYCSMLLADLGAAVIKVESPGAGDDTRQWRPPEWNGLSATFLAGNRGKRSIAVDLDSEAGQDVVRRLAAKADVVISSFRPGSLAKRGLDHESLRRDSPGLVYCSISAYGSQGPKRDWPGYDPILQAESGMMSLTGYPEGPRPGSRSLPSTSARPCGHRSGFRPLSAPGTRRERAGWSRSASTRRRPGGCPI